MTPLDYGPVITLAIDNDISAAELLVVLRDHVEVCELQRLRRKVLPQPQPIVRGSHANILTALTLFSAACLIGAAVVSYLLFRGAP